MTASNDVLVSDALLEDKFVTIWPDYPCLYDVRAFDFRNRFATAGHGSHMGGAGSDNYVFRKCHACSNIYQPRGYRFATYQMELRELKLEHS